jgi:hypothetical protein
MISPRLDCSSLFSVVTLVEMISLLYMGSMVGLRGRARILSIEYCLLNLQLSPQYLQKGQCKLSHAGG